MIMVLWMTAERKLHAGRAIYLAHLYIPSSRQIVSAQKILVEWTKKRMNKEINKEPTKQRNECLAFWVCTKQSLWAKVAHSSGRQQTAGSYCGGSQTLFHSGLRCPSLLKHLVPASRHQPSPGTLSLTLSLSLSGLRSSLFWWGCQGEGLKCLRRDALADVGRQWSTVSFASRKTKCISSCSSQGIRDFSGSQHFLVQAVTSSSPPTQPLDTKTLQGRMRMREFQANTDSAKLVFSSMAEGEGHHRGDSMLTPGPHSDVTVCKKCSEVTLATCLALFWILY